MEKHVSVLKKEVIEFLSLKDGNLYYDATFGAGGHSKEILKKDVTLWVTDKDKTVTPLLENDNFHFVRSDFVDFLKNEKYSHLMFDGILADFGVSNMQLMNTERGFSFMRDAALDMRMDQTQEITAYEIVNDYTDKELYDVIKYYGEEKKASRIVNNIVKHRPINTTLELASVIEEVKKRGKSKTHPATKTFQAIRIEVNSELKKIEEFLDLAVNRLNPGGRLVVISFHSLEDRIVKNRFREYKKDCICPKELPVCSCSKISLGEIITRKPIIATEEEVNLNPKSRSAKLRVFEVR